MTAGLCITVVCASTDTRLYLNGPACDQHSPWARGGRPDPRTQIDPNLTDSARRISSASPWTEGATDLDKKKPGGYTSKQRAIKLAAARDAASTIQHTHRADIDG